MQEETSNTPTDTQEAEVGGAIVKGAGLQRQGKGTKKATIPGSEVPPEAIDVLKVYSMYAKAVEASPIRAIYQVLAFMDLPTKAFCPVPLPRMDGYHEKAYHDVTLYLSCVGELYYKIMLMLEYAEAEKPASYNSAWQALQAGRQRLTQIDPALGLPLIEKYDEVLSLFHNYCMLVMATDVLPDPVRMFGSLQGALMFMLTSPDALFHLVRLNGATRYLNSGYADSSVRTIQNISEAYDLMLDEYKKLLDGMVCC